MHHSGEVAVQRRAGFPAVAHGSARVGNAVPPRAEQFLHEQPMIVVAAMSDDAVWTTILTGPPGFVRHVGDAVFRVDATLPPVDPLAGAFGTPRPIGMLAIEPATRRRMRINGTARADGTALVVEADQVLSNCPKYLTARHGEPAELTSPATVARTGTTLSPEQVAWIGSADTFFVGTRAPGLGADASHRGGDPGFVVATPGRLTWPEYVGNSMYMTLGNLQLDPRAGLLFADWENGRTLHLTGTATVDWDEARAARFPGAERLVDLRIQHVVELEHRFPLRWRLDGLSRYNPRITDRPGARATAGAPGAARTAEA
ncbi:pyridoxamine 5'-phosphate oxidase family protein [Myceligenerans crystallogenes]|uniref:Pyridoxamine 5'-phosphate oxidase family protein n=1 Tax=Myceligenerans crystallogenes TaxID=316335 RepID=A0ABP4ZMR8_9MICO